MNKIVDRMYEVRQGHYCHALEVNDVYELQSAIDAIYEEFVDEFGKEEVIDFLQTLELYYLGSDPVQEKEIYDYDIAFYVNQL